MSKGRGFPTSASVRVDTQTLHGLDGVLDKLKALPPEVVSKRGGPVKSALRKGAVVIQKEWISNIKAIIAEPNKGDVPADSTGLLVKNVVVTRDSRPWRSQANERYVVRVRNKRYPKASPGQKQAATTAQVARLLENGSEHIAPRHWASKGFMTSRQLALNTVVRELNAGIERVIRKMSR